MNYVEYKPAKREKRNTVFLKIKIREEKRERPHHAANAVQACSEWIPPSR